MTKATKATYAVIRITLNGFDGRVLTYEIIIPKDNKFKGFYDFMDDLDADSVSNDNEWNCGGLPQKLLSILCKGQKLSTDKEIETLYRYMLNEVAEYSTAEFSTVKAALSFTKVVCDADTKREIKFSFKKCDGYLIPEIPKKFGIAEITFISTNSTRFVVLPDFTYYCYSNNSQIMYWYRLKEDMKDYFEEYKFKEFSIQQAALTISKMEPVLDKLRRFDLIKASTADIKAMDEAQFKAFYGELEDAVQEAIGCAKARNHTKGNEDDWRLVQHPVVSLPERTIADFYPISRFALEA